MGGDGQTNLMLVQSLFCTLGSRLTRFNDFDKQNPDYYVFSARVKKLSDRSHTRKQEQVSEHRIR